VCSVPDVEEIGVFITSDAELSQVDAAVLGWKQMCPLYRKVTAQLAVCSSTRSLQHPVVPCRHLEMEAGCSYKTLEHLITTWCKNPKHDHHLNNCHENLITYMDLSISG